MRLSDDGFYGPRKVIKRLVIYPPYAEDVPVTVYGYESSSNVYEVVYLPRPIWEPSLKVYVAKYYDIIGGPSTLEPTAVHKTIEKRFNL